MKKRPKNLYKSIQGRKHDRTKLLSLNKIKRMLEKIILNKIVLAVVAGLIVGSIFGLTSLHLLTDNSDAHVFQEQPSSKEQPTQTSSTDTLTNITFNIPSVYVIQVGLFHERENAELRKRQLQRGKVTTFIWRRSEQFFLLHSLHSDESKAKQINEKLHDDSVEAFVKKWDMPKTTKRVTSGEQQFIEQFARLWEQSLHEIEADGSIPIEKWQELQRRENDSSLISAIQLKLENVLSNLEDKHFSDIDLLQLLFLIEESVTE